jgi:ribosome-binding protein aMBF1 (putative translation factor)
MELQDALRQAIVDSGLSYYRLAKDSGVNAVVISRFAAGERDLRLKTASRIAKALRLELTTA